jgi:PPK2 family polyphosphate:nucleotide phosphotransferase
MRNQYRVKDNRFTLSDYDPDDHGTLDKKAQKSRFKENIRQIKELQYRMYAEDKRSLLVVLQALDAGGKDGTIRKVFGPINPQGCRVTSFKVPTKLESSHDFLWRIHQAAPASGKIAVFNRSHYESVLIEAVHGWINPKEEERRLAHIRSFEALLADRGTVILKFFLLISKDEQKRRFQERLDNPEKNWKFSSGDLKERRHFEAYLGQFEKVLGATSTDNAPWFVVPANDKKYRNYVISSIVQETLEEMNLSFLQRRRPV